MIIITSLSPFHTNNSLQLSCIKSWQKYGHCYSLNTITEIDQMKLIYENDIEFVKTHKTVKPIFGKNLISINAMIDHAIKIGDNLMLINSDIYIDSIPELKEDGITIFSRFDYTEHFGDAKRFELGFDAFFVPYSFLNIFPPSTYALGNCHFDHWIPYRTLINSIPLYWPQGTHIYHKLHNAQYSSKEWERTGEYFKWEFNFPKHLSIGQIATEILKEIKDNAIKI